MSNIYVKITIEKKWRTHDFHFLSLKSSSPQTSCSNLKIRGLAAKLWVDFLFFHFERNYDVSKSKGPWFLLNKNMNFNKNQKESKMNNPAHSCREINRALQLELKVKLWWVGSRERKKSAFFVTFISFEGNFFNICVLSQSIVY